MLGLVKIYPRQRLGRGLPYGQIATNKIYGVGEGVALGALRA